MKKSYCLTVVFALLCAVLVPSIKEASAEDRATFNEAAFRKMMEEDAKYPSTYVSPDYHDQISAMNAKMAAEAVNRKLVKEEEEAQDKRSRDYLKKYIEDKNKY